MLLNHLLIDSTQSASAGCWINTKCRRHRISLTYIIKYKLSYMIYHIWLPHKPLETFIFGIFSFTNWFWFPKKFQWYFHLKIRNFLTRPNSNTQLLILSDEWYLELSLYKWQQWRIGQFLTMTRVTQTIIRVSSDSFSPWLGWLTEKIRKPAFHSIFSKTINSCKKYDFDTSLFFSDDKNPLF